MANPKKPASQRQRRGTPDVGIVSAKPAPASTPTDLRALPALPGNRRLLKSTRDAWHRYWEEADVSKLVTASDLTALHRLFHLYDLRTRLEQVAMKAPIVEGSQGQPRANPVLDKVTALDAQILQLEDRFGMSPRSRLNLGVTFSHAVNALDSMNAAFDEDDDQDDDDPRLRAIDTSAS